MGVELSIINTSYQKLPFGSGDYPDKLLFHQAGPCLGGHTAIDVTTRVVNGPFPETYVKCVYSCFYV